MVKAKRKSTPPGGTFNALPNEWQKSRNEWLNRVPYEHAAEFAAMIRHEAQIKELRAIREAVTSASPALPSPPVKKQRDKPKSRRILIVLQELYPLGKAPAGLLDKTIIAAVFDEFRKRHWRCPDRKTIMRVVDEIGWK